jgi:hypothetical protein
VLVIDTKKSLAAIRAALDPISPGSTERDMEAATAAATDELRQVAYGVAAFANGLDDGVGFFNSSTEFGEQLAAGLDEARRMSTVSGLLRGLEVDEVLHVVEFALLQLNAASGPHGHPRVLLDAANRKALQRISESVSSTLLDADMPADPEDED